MLAGLASGLAGVGGGGLADSGFASSSGEQRVTFGGVTIGMSQKQLALYGAAAAVVVVLLVAIAARR